MRIDLSQVDIFDRDEINFDKKITFIFGKNGTGKSTITGELRKLSPEYEVFAFQGFSNLIDENKRLNAVVLGEENATISRQIEAKKVEMEAKKKERASIINTLQKPEDDNVSNFWTKKMEAEKKYDTALKDINDIYTKIAAKIKKIDKPRVAKTTYNKLNLQYEIKNAVLLREEDINQYTETINSEVKEAPEIIFPNFDFEKLHNDINTILQKYVIEKIKISRLENNIIKREFAKLGLTIHKKGDICSFCGSKIEDVKFDELVSYFSADEVKSFQDEIQNKIKEINIKIDQLIEICIDTNKFYPEFLNEAKKVSDELEKKKKEMLSHLEELKKALDEKLKYLFESCSDVKEVCFDNFNEIEKQYQSLRKRNNENDLIKKKEEAINKLRNHYIKKFLDDFKYDSLKLELETFKILMDQHNDEFDTEQKKITGIGGLDEVIEAIQDNIVDLQNNTKNETLLAQNINKKLKHMVSFELVHVEDKESKGFYRVKNCTTGCEREITELSTGEKNIIAFLYFIEKLDEIKEVSINKPRVIVFDDPMCSNDDGMQYLIIEELQKLMKTVQAKDHFILLTHNKHFYLNVKYGHRYTTDRFIRFQSDSNKTHFVIINNENEDYKTSYESLWSELKFLYGLESVSADLLLNPIRRIIETFTKFNGIDKVAFCTVGGAMKLFNVNSHSIDDIEAELNGKTKNEIIQIFYDCFSKNNKTEHINKFWSELTADEKGYLNFEGC